MPEAQKESYPAIPMKHWWMLRTRFKQSIPATVTPGYLSTVLQMKEQSAKANVIPSLIIMGLIDEEGKPTDRANKWRDDQDYAQVCHEIRQEVYPQELIDAVPGPIVDRPAIERWFAANTGVGKAAAQRYTLVYELLTTATIPDSLHAARTLVGQKPPAAHRRVKAREKSAPTKAEKPVAFSGLEPAIHIGIQIHISPDAKPDQIDVIFASMTKHLRDLRVVHERTE